MLPFGLLKFAWLNTLKNSARKSTRWLSPRKLFRMGTDLTAEKSTFLYPGPVSGYLPDVPSVPTGFCTKAWGLNHCKSFWPFVRSPERFGSPTRLARLPPPPIRALSMP